MTAPIPINKALTVNRTQDREGKHWRIQSPETLTDAEAAAITFRAEPTDVVVGEYVEVEDANGIRIGHLATAQYKEPLFAPAFALCSIELR